jgi:hypothetical protein
MNEEPSAAPASAERSASLCVPLLFESLPVAMPAVLSRYRTYNGSDALLDERPVDVRARWYGERDVEDVSDTEA